MHAFAFAAAHVCHRLQCSTEQCSRFGLQGLGIDFSLGDDTGPAQDVDGMR